MVNPIFPNHKDFNKTATLSLPAAREYFALPSITYARKTPPRQFDVTPLSSAFKHSLPSLDFSNPQVAQAGQYWSGATASTGVITAPPSNTLPTPPTAETDVFKPPGQCREGSFNVTNVGLQQPGMASNIEPQGTGSSLTARRPAATSLPNFELPPPQQLTQKFLPYTALNTSCINNQPPQSSISSVGNLLTPPPNLPGDSLSPISSGVSSVSPAAANGLPPYTPTGYWSSGATGITPYSMGGSNTPQPWGPATIHSFPPPRGMFSPSLNALMRNNTNSPSTSEGLPPPPPGSSSFDVAHLPPFPTSLSMSAPANLPAVPNQPSTAQAQAFVNSQTPGSASTSQPSPVNGSDSYLQRPPPTPTYYGGSQPSSTPQQPQFAAFQSNSPVQQSPMSASTQGSRISPTSVHPPSIHPASSHPGQPGNRFVAAYPGPYSLPAMSPPNLVGPILSNIHNPGGPVAILAAGPNGIPGMMPSFNSGHSAQVQQLYGGSQQAPHHERPFKCDQCPQSFNRNHDLKRHKRIHLAVKPFPCGHCEKSFSRKDALKVTSPTSQVKLLG